MDKRAEFFSNSIACNCGNVIDVEPLINDLTSDAMICSGISAGNDTYHCNRCDREHKLKLEVSVEVDVSCLDLTSISPITDYKDKEHKLVPTSFFNDLTIGSKTPNLHDGQYVIEDWELIFEVENGEINNIFSTKVDSNQVSLFD